MELPEPIALALEPLFERVPLQEAMQTLLVKGAPPSDRVRLVEDILKNPELSQNPRLAAGLWLYVDDLDRSHRISQTMEDSTGAYWHGIMHRREGDFSNSHYWFSRVGQHPVMDELEGYNPHQFVDEVEERHDHNPPELVDCQRQEWVALFEWCARQ